MSGIRLKNKSRSRRSLRRKSAGPKPSAKSRGRKRPRVAFKMPSFEWSFRRTALVAASCALVLGMALVMLLAPGWGRGEQRFLLSQFEVRGNRVLTEDEVLDISGAEIGSNLLDVKISMLEEALAASPRVDRAQVRRVLPDRVVVTLDEKRPAAFVACGVDEMFEVTEDGSFLPPAARTAAVDLPVITGAVGDVGTDVCELSPELLDVLALLRRAREVSEGLWMDISEVRIAPGSGLVIYAVADGAEIRVGSGALGSEDLERLWRVMSDIRDRGLEAETIDLRFRDQVIVRLS